MILRNKECFHCKGLKICRADNRSWFFVIVGFISTIAIRVVTVLMDINPVHGKTAWYIGVAGFVIFFVYKYRVFKARARLIEGNRLIEKIGHKEELSDEDYKIIASILCKIKSNQERINFLFIFVVSLIALSWAIFNDFLLPGINGVRPGV